MTRLPAYLLAALGVATLVGFLVFPTYPNYDSYYSLLWGREVLDLEKPYFDGFRVPTEHPLAIAAGAVLSLLGDGADRVWILMCLGSLVWLAWGIFRLGEHAFTTAVGLIAAGLLLTRFDFAFLAARGYIDVPYMAMIVWATVLEVRSPRRGAPVLVLLGLAGMLRPEAWFMAAAYWLWVSWRASWNQRVRFAALAALGPGVWFATDFVVTGNPLFSLQYTSNLAEDLGRSRTLAELPAALPYFFSSLVKLPVLLAALAGIVAGVVISPRGALGPLVLFTAGLGTFILIGAAGASIIERYLVLSALALLVFAGVALGGWTMLAPGRLRTGWMTAAIVVALAGATYTALNVSLRRFETELSFRGQAHDSLAEVLRSPQVAAGLRCGPLTLPNHKLVPDTRWILDLPPERVLARADPDVSAQTGVAIYVVSRIAIFKHAFTSDDDDATIQVPPAGWRRAVTSDFYSAYVRC